jgi:hypothetical protein
LEDIVKFVATVLAALFIATIAAPAEAARKSTDTTFKPGTSFTLISTIPGLNGCC